MPAAPKQTSGPKGGGKRSEYQDKEKPTQIRFSNINASKGLFTFIVCDRNRLTQWSEYLGLKLDIKNLMYCSFTIMEIGHTKLKHWISWVNGSF
jgi:hypothetical protein